MKSSAGKLATQNWRATALSRRYETPRTWLRVPALPVNAAGKIDKALLRGEGFLRSHGVL